MRIRVTTSADEAAAEAARWFVAALRRDIAERGAAGVAFSGGSTPRRMIALLADARLDWARIDVYQVDERIAADGDPARNAGLLEPLPLARSRRHLMGVTSTDLAAAARRYGRALPERLDVVHLGLGDDGHTASWLPGDDAAHADADVAISREYQGHRRMTLTARPVNRARRRLLLVTGESKAEALAGFVLGDGQLPVDALRRTNVTVIADAGAASALPTPD